MEKTALSISEQIKVALDGRTQRWLSLEAKIPEADLSKKMNGVEGFLFTQEEINRINARLGCTIVMDAE